MQPLFAPTTFLACRSCGVVLPVRPPERFAESIDELGCLCDRFSSAHRPHGLIGLLRCTSEVRADRGLWDPMATIRFEATDGRETFVVTSLRQSIDEPRQYHLTSGSLPVTSQEISIADGDVRRGLDMEFQPHAIRPTKVERFISALHEAVRSVRPQELSICYDLPDDPALSVAPMPDAAFESVVAACAEIFDSWEFPRIHRFLLANRADDGLLMLRVRRLEDGAQASEDVSGPL
jgi:hypothetical protein